MKTLKIKKHFAIAPIAMISLLTINAAEAGTILINNHSSNNIEVKVVPEPIEYCRPYCKTCLPEAVCAAGEQAKKIVVPAEAFGGKQSFSAIGSEGGFLGTGECKGLNVLKDYEISFSETTGGLRCDCKSL